MRDVRLKPGAKRTAELLIGAAPTIGFAAGFSVESWLVHSWLLAALAAMVSLSLLVTVDLNRPFSGDIRVEPMQFRSVSAQLGGGGTSP